MKKYHYLISMHLTPRPETMHCYVVSNRKDAAKGAASRMLDVMDEHGIVPILPMFMQTPLTGEYIERVQETFTRLSPEVGECIATMKDHHLSIISVVAGSPPDEVLMAIH